MAYTLRLTKTYFPGVRYSEAFRLDTSEALVITNNDYDFGQVQAWGVLTLGHDNPDPAEVYPINEQTLLFYKSHQVIVPLEAVTFQYAGFYFSDSYPGTQISVSWHTQKKLS